MKSKHHAKQNLAIALWSGVDRDSPLKAVVMRKVADDFEILDQVVRCDGGTTLGEFIGELAGRYRALNGSIDPIISVAVDSAPMAFYSIDLPAVKDARLESIVRMQAETILPLPISQMHLAWRAARPTEQGRACVIAAARKKTIGSLLESARDGGASMVLPDAEAVVRIWRQFFGGTDDCSVILHIRQVDTRLLLARDGVLLDAVTIDVGTDDLNNPQNRLESSELFVHDLRNTLDRFAQRAVQTTKAFILSENASTYKELIACLSQAGIEVAPAVPRLNVVDTAFDLHGAGEPGDKSRPADSHLFAARGELTPADIFKNLEAIGAGILALDGRASVINMLYAEEVQARQKARSARSMMTAVAAVSAVLMLFVFLLVARSVDEAALEKMENTDMSALVKLQDTRKAIFEQRPDILDVLTKLNQSTQPGMLLDSFVFQKAQAITIKGTASSYEQLYEFEKVLRSQKGITEVNLQKPTFDEKKKQVTFKMTFHYKRFTRKK